MVPIWIVVAIETVSLMPNALTAAEFVFMVRLCKEMDEKLLGKCGFYCGGCPTYIKGGCRGCMDEHETGDCFTRDCVLRQSLPFCGACEMFPCETILTRPRTTVLDRDWLRWKKESNTTDKEKNDDKTYSCVQGSL